MHDIWNPWHGCVKCSEGCQNCYMYFLDRVRDKNGADIFKTQNGFRYPLQKKRGGENYDGSRPCHYEWVKLLYEQCKAHDVTFNFIETGTVFVKDGKTYRIPNKQVQAQQAYRSALQHKGKPIGFKLHDGWGYEIPKEQLYVPHYHPVTCRECASRLTCNGCSDCGKCEKKKEA